MSMVNSDLPNTFGNLLQRISSKHLIISGPEGLTYHRSVIPLPGDNLRASAEDDALIQSLCQLPGGFPTPWENLY